MLPTYVITQRACTPHDAPHYHEEQTDDLEAIAAFTQRSAAERYRDQLGRRDQLGKKDQEITELDDLQFLRWIAKAHQHGTQYLMIDPDLANPSADVSQTIVIEEKMAGFAENLTRKIAELASKEGPH